MKRQLVFGIIVASLLTLSSGAIAQTTLVAQLSGPGPASEAGLAVLSIDAANTTLTYNVILTGVPGTINSVSINVMNGGDATLDISLPPNPSQTVYKGSIPVSVDQINSLVNGQMTIVVDTVASPNGELSGTILRALQPNGGGTTYYPAILDGNGESPAVTTNGNGVALFSLDASNNLHYSLVVDSLTNNTGADVDLPGSPPTLITTLTVPNSGNISLVTGQSAAPLSQASLTSLNSGSLYVNVETQANPGGEIRGQIIAPSDNAVHLYPAPTMISAGSTGIVSIRVDNAVNLTVGKFTATVTPVGTTPPPAASITGITAGAQTAMDQGCTDSGCATAVALQSNPDFLSGPVVGGPVTASFLLSSDINDKGGVTGNAQEVAQLMVSVPPSATAGQTYKVVITSIDNVNPFRSVDFSISSSVRVPVVVGSALITITVGNGTVHLLAGPDTAYRDLTYTDPNALLLVPTCGPTTNPASPGFPNDGRAVGNQTYSFTVTSADLGSQQVQWTVVANNHPGSTYTPGQLANLTGTITATGPGGTVGIYTPADPTMQMPNAIDLTFTASVVGNAMSTPAMFTATMFPYGDANLDGQVNIADAFNVFQWSNGVNLPVLPTGANPLQLNAYVGLTVRRLLTDIGPLPGGLNPNFSSWVTEYNRLVLTPPVQSAYDRTGFPFGDGAATLPEAFWIYLKGVYTGNANAPATLDPRIHTNDPTANSLQPIPYDF